MFKIFSIISLFLGQALSATDVPGGLIRTAESLKINTYELVLSPQYVISEKGTYLTSELRYQVNEDLSTGFGFGSGELGFNFGAHGVWHVSPDLDYQPAFAIVGGLYFNRINSTNYMVLKFAPTVSKSYHLNWGEIGPYAGLQLSPSFGLGVAGSKFSMRASMGSQLIITAFSGLRLWLEAGLSISQSFNEIGFGISYPFAALGG